MITIQLNGERRKLGGEIAVSGLLQQLELTPQRVAVEINEQLVKRAAFDQVTIRDGDRVEVVTLVGGG